MNGETVYEVVKKLTGECYPYGSHSIDQDRYKSLNAKIYVASALLDEIEEAGRYCEGEKKDYRTPEKRILDACCGSKMFWFNKENPEVVFCDIRELKTTLCDGRSLEIKPDLICDFRHLPFEDNTFFHVVFDPPHLFAGETSWSAQKYGTLKGKAWESIIKEGFDECYRVLKPNGTLIFKWNETDIPVSKVLELIQKEPLYGHKVGKLNKTHWLAFIK